MFQVEFNPDGGKWSGSQTGYLSGKNTSFTHLN